MSKSVEYSLIGLLFAGSALSVSGQSAARPPRPLPPLVPIVQISAPRRPLPDESKTGKITKFSFIAYGDTRGRNDTLLLQEAHGWVVESLVQRVKAVEKTDDPIMFVVQSGDAVQSGLNGKMLNVGFTPLINRITHDAGIPYFLSVGNHDVTGSSDINDPGRKQGLYNTMAANAALIPAEGSPRRLKGYPTYAVAYGNTFIIAFDSQIAGDTVQFNWMKSQLEGLDRKRYVNIMVFAHSPVYTSGGHGGARSVEPQMIIMREKFMPLFRKHHVKLFLAGHDHVFDHWVERYEDGGKQYRLDQIVSGGGGAPIYDYAGEPDLAKYLADGARQKVTVEHFVKATVDTLQMPHHYLIVHVDGDKITIEPVGVGWGSAWKPYSREALLLEDRRP